MRSRDHRLLRTSLFSFVSCLCASSLWAQSVTFLPYIPPGDNGPFGRHDQMVVAWQTDESSPAPSAYVVQYGRTLTDLTPAVVDARVVDDYLSADAQFSALDLPFRYGAHSDYTAVLTLLAYNTMYFYKVTGPGLPPDGFVASFHTRKTGRRFAFQVQGR